MTHFNRRFFLTTSAAAVGIGALQGGTVAKGDFEITRSVADWQARLTEAEFDILREGGTERAFTSPLNDETRPGTFNCKGCDLPLYDAATKFKSGTGWPSFTAALDGAVGTMPDNTLFSRRTEVHCARCGSHMGHVFDDGPAPTGKRHCINGLALTFTAA